MLTQSMLSALLVYCMQTALLPTKTSEDIDKLCWDFLWGQTMDKKVHLVSWVKVVRSKSTSAQFGDLYGLKTWKWDDLAHVLLL